MSTRERVVKIAPETITKELPYATRMLQLGTGRVIAASEQFVISLVEFGQMNPILRSDVYEVPLAVVRTEDVRTATSDAELAACVIQLPVHFPIDTSIPMYFDTSCDTGNGAQTLYWISHDNRLHCLQVGRVMAYVDLYGLPPPQINTLVHTLEDHEKRHHQQQQLSSFSTPKALLQKTLFSSIHTIDVIQQRYMLLVSHLGNIQQLELHWALGENEVDFGKYTPCMYVYVKDYPLPPGWRVSNYNRLMSDATARQPHNAIMVLQRLSELNYDGVVLCEHMKAAEMHRTGIPSLAPVYGAEQNTAVETKADTNQSMRFSEACITDMYATATATATATVESDGSSTILSNTMNRDGKPLALVYALNNSELLEHGMFRTLMPMWSVPDCVPQAIQQWAVGSNGGAGDSAGSDDMLRSINVAAYDARLHLDLWCVNAPHNDTERVPVPTIVYDGSPTGHLVIPRAGVPRFLSFGKRTGEIHIYQVQFTPTAQEEHWQVTREVCSIRTRENRAISDVVRDPLIMLSETTFVVVLTGGRLMLFEPDPTYARTKPIDNADEFLRAMAVTHMTEQANSDRTWALPEYRLLYGNVASMIQKSDETNVSENIPSPAPSPAPAPDHIPKDGDGGDDVGDGDGAIPDHQTERFDSLTHALPQPPTPYRWHIRPHDSLLQRFFRHCHTNLEVAKTLKLVDEGCDTLPYLTPNRIAMSRAAELFMCERLILPPYAWTHISTTAVDADAATPVASDTIAVENNPVKPWKMVTKIDALVYEMLRSPALEQQVRQRNEEYTNACLELLTLVPPADLFDRKQTVASLAAHYAFIEKYFMSYRIMKRDLNTLLSSVCEGQLARVEAARRQQIEAALPSNRRGAKLDSGLDALVEFATRNNWQQRGQIEFATPNELIRFLAEQWDVPSEYIEHTDRLPPNFGYAMSAIDNSLTNVIYALARFVFLRYMRYDSEMICATEAPPLYVQMLQLVSIVYTLPWSISHMQYAALFMEAYVLGYAEYRRVRRFLTPDATELEDVSMWSDCTWDGYLNIIRRRRDQLRPSELRQCHGFPATSALKDWDKTVKE